MNIEIAIAGGEDEAGAKLERIRSQLVLAVAGGLGTCPCLEVIATQEMEQVPRFQSGGLVGFALGIDQQGKGDAGLFAKQAGIIHVAQSDGGQPGSGLLEFIFVRAQLRDVLAAEDSTVMAQKDNDSRTTLPERAEPDFTSISFGQNKIRELGTE